MRAAPILRPEAPPGASMALTAADLAERAAALFQPRPGGPSAQAEAGGKPIRQMREHHHMLARLVASGESDAAVAAIVGIDPARIRLLKTSPSFQELVHMYAERQDELRSDIGAKLDLLALDALAIIHERLLDPEQADKISEGTLLSMVEKVLDRRGHPVVSKTEALIVGAHLSPYEVARLQGTAERVEVVTNVRALLKPGPLIDVTPAQPNETVGAEAEPTEDGIL